jgi:tetratricopeptide (TPR) repeat protein
MANKLEKKALEKPDKLTLFFAKVRVFIETNRKRIYLVSAIFLGIFALTTAFYLYQMQYEKKAMGLYNSVLNESAKIDPSAREDAAIKGLKDLIDKYPRSNAAALGHYRLGNLYYKQKQDEKAISRYREFIKRSDPGNDLLTLAYHSLGALEERKNNLKKALEYYELAAKTKTAPSFEALNYENMARVYEKMKDNKKASEFYKKTLSKTTDTVATLLLKRKLSTL